MDTPYIAALSTPLCLLCCFVKKETVSGIMGKTQGVSKAMKPPNNPRIKMPSMLLFRVISSPQLSMG